MRLVWTPKKKNQATQKTKKGQYQVVPDSSVAIFTSEDRGVQFILQSVAYEPAALASLGSLLEVQNLSCHSIPIESEPAFDQVFR